MDANPFAVSGWYVDRLEATAHLEGEQPRFDSLREIIATHTGVEQICESWSIPRPANEPLLDDLDLIATEGCTVTDLEKISAQHLARDGRLGRAVGPATALPDRLRGHIALARLCATVQCFRARAANAIIPIGGALRTRLGPHRGLAHRRSPAPGHGRRRPNRQLFRVAPRTTPHRGVEDRSPRAGVRDRVGLVGAGGCRSAASPRIRSKVDIQASRSSITSADA